MCVCVRVEAILLLAAVKVLNANHEALKGEVLGFLREIQECASLSLSLSVLPRPREDNADVELQQRAVELLQLSRDEVRFSEAPE